MERPGLDPRKFRLPDLDVPSLVCPPRFVWPKIDYDAKSRCVYDGGCTPGIGLHRAPDGKREADRKKSVERELNGQRWTLEAALCITRDKRVAEKIKITT
ncbi:Uncharacterised protein g4416 [Pycnogonum litorale]